MAGCCAVAGAACSFCFDDGWRKAMRLKEITRADVKAFKIFKKEAAWLRSIEITWQASMEAKERALMEKREAAASA